MYFMWKANAGTKSIQIFSIICGIFIINVHAGPLCFILIFAFN